jgi:glycine/D-amino acid oxidase-like deaminating enzyme
MSEAPWDVIIVGQGIAGTTLAWHLLKAGQRVLILDACEPVTSSKIAAGLITPITGQRLKLSWRYDEFLPVARDFYAGVEKRTKRKLLHDRIALRLFKSDEERQYWSDRSRQPAYQAHLLNPQPTQLLDPDLGDASGGGFAMHAAQLDVPAYLEASRAVLEWEEMTLDWQRDVTISEDEISVAGHRTRILISCEGYAATRNPYFSWVPFNAAKGDILTVRFHRPVPPRNLHRGIWVAPTTDEHIFRIGSTYDWEQLDDVPSAIAREQIEQSLQEFFHVPYTVVEHHAAVRPIINESKPLIGLHPKLERLGFFNGLGSKGSLLAPWFAQCFTDFLVHQTPLPEDADIRKHS